MAQQPVAGPPWEAVDVAARAVEVVSIRRCHECPFFAGDGYCTVAVMRVARPRPDGYEGPPPAWCPLRAGMVIVERSPKMPPPPSLEEIRHQGGDATFTDGRTGGC